MEALISTLRSHLTRLTAELSEHKQLLLELRSLRDSDARKLAEKSKEVDKLKNEVERLAGEVGVLRGVVEEGLKERRTIREQSVNLDQEATAPSAEESSEEESSNEESQQHGHPASVHSESSEEEEEESISRRSPTPSPRRRLGANVADKTMRTDHATIASSQLPSVSANTSRPFLDNDELSRITQEVEERRSERSIQSQSRSQEDSQSQASSSSASQELVRSWSRNPNPPESRRVSRAPSPSMMLDADPSASASASMMAPVPPLEHSVRFAAAPSQASTSRPVSPVPAPAPRPSAPTPAAAQRNIGHGQKRRPHPTAPVATAADDAFPQIRGARLERLFFSAPEHNAETCTVCHRRRRRRPSGGDGQSPESWLRAQERRREGPRGHEDEDEGFAEGEDDVRERLAYAAKAARDRNGGDRLPPQTVLARILRELEDDFTHYKRYVDLHKQTAQPS